MWDRQTVLFRVSHLQLRMRSTRKMKMMHFGVFCVQFHRPRARMNEISNVLESSIALAAVAGSLLAARSVFSSFNP